jgi:predicted ester cyclase
MGKGAAMSTEESRRVALLFHNCNLEEHKLLLSESFVGHDAMGHSFGSDFQIKGLEVDLKAFAGLHDEIHDVVSENDKVAIRFTRSGKFTKQFEDFTPTNNEVHFHVLEILHIKDGQVCEAWFYNDDGTIANELRRTK